MLVKVNGDFVEIETKSNIEDLLIFLDIPKVRIAVELNDEAVPTPASTRSSILDFVSISTSSPLTFTNI